jgi:hypothetical protein
MIKGEIQYRESINGLEANLTWLLQKLMIFKKIIYLNLIITFKINQEFAFAYNFFKLIFKNV